jgi:flagellar hook-associated protein 3 FlgL
MRITNLMIQKNLVTGLRARLESVARASTQATTGQRINTVSDDPVDASQIMRMTSQIGDIDQFRRNGTFATTKLSTEDVAISSLRDAISKAKTLALSNTSSDPNDPIRQAALNEAKSLKDQMVALGNTQVGDQYIFGGDYSTAPPFQSNGTYVGNLSPQQVEISSGVTISVNHAGQPLFTDALTAIDNLITQLGSGTPDQINAAATNLTAAGDTALGLQAEVGSRLQDIQTASTNLAAQSSSLMDRRDSLSTVDQATAIVDLQNEQTALERAYAVVGRVMQSSLTDYLK